MRAMGIVRFGTFEVHLHTAELFKQGRLIRLQQQPFEVLRALLEHPGDLVSRDALRRRLWPDGVTVGFDQSLNKCVTKLRDALGDTAANPRFIETLPKRGYRFIAPVSEAVPQASPLPADTMYPPQPPMVTAAPLAPPSTPLIAPGTTDARPFPARPPFRLRPGVATWAGLTATLAALAVWLSAAPAVVDETADETPALVEPAAASPIFAARDAFARGREAADRQSDESVRASATHFARAIALSPRFAEAHVGLAESWAVLGSRGLADPREAMPRSRDSATRGLLLAPRLARAHAVLARTTMLFDLDWKTAEWHFTRAMELAPGEATTHEWLAELWSALGDHERAVAEARRAVAAEPLSLRAGTTLGTTLRRARATDAAASQLERTLEIDPDFAPARRALAFVRMQQGRPTDARAEFERVARVAGDSAPARAELAWAHAMAGQREAARRLLAAVTSGRHATYVPADALALVHAALGDRDAALAALARAVAERAAGVAFLGADPSWDTLRPDPRFARLEGLIQPQR